MALLLEFDGGHGHAAREARGLPLRRGFEQLVLDQVDRLEPSGQHFSAVVVSPESARPLIHHHDLVLDTVRAQIASNEPHALSINTHAPHQSP